MRPLRGLNSRAARALLGLAPSVMIGAVGMTFLFCSPARANSWLSCSPTQLQTDVLPLPSSSAVLILASGHRVPACAELGDGDWFLATAAKHSSGQPVFVFLTEHSPVNSRAEVARKVFELGSALRL